MASDLETLLDMGFEESRVEIALRQPGGCTIMKPILCRFLYPVNSTDDLASARSPGVAGEEPRQIYRRDHCC